jgi:dGTPase
MKILGNKILDTLIKDMVDNNRLSEPARKHLKLSPKIAAAVDELYSFMYKKVYTNCEAKTEEKKVPAMITLLFNYYLKQNRGKNIQEVADSIACMTDRYAINKFKELFVPGEWRTA